MKKIVLTYCLFLSALFCVQHTRAGETYDVNYHTSKASLNAQLVDVYPNPAVDNIFLKFQDPIAQKVSLEIRSFIGNKLDASFSIENADLLKVDISNLAAGHYYVIITLDGDKTLKKFIKKG